MYSSFNRGFLNFLKNWQKYKYLNFQHIFLRYKCYCILQKWYKKNHWSDWNYWFSEYVYQIASQSIVAWEIVYTILKSIEKNEVSRKTRLKFHYLISCSFFYLTANQPFLLHRMNLPLLLAVILCLLCLRRSIRSSAANVHASFWTLVPRQAARIATAFGPMIKFNTCIIKRMLAELLLNILAAIYVAILTIFVP